jgi:hypothetical protein
MLSKVGHVIERVKRFLGEHIDEFHRGDIIVEIGYTLKYIVMDEYKTVYYLKPMWNVEGRFPKECNWLGKHEGNHEKFWVEGSAVKVGKWDFDSEREVEDDD